MSRNHIDHGDIARFAQDRVNLPKDKANEYRTQARRLRKKLEQYLGQHPDFSLRKMMISGSLAKGTALRTLNDIDVACYVSGANAPTEVSELLSYIAEKLRKAFPNFSHGQVTPQTYSISVSFKGSGLDVDIVPILYYDDEDWYGYLVSQDDGTLLRTNIPRHLDFIRERKRKHGQNFSQVIRLLKHWASKEKREKSGFRFKSFMIELILAKLSDDGKDFSDYPEAMQSFFTYLANTCVREMVVFSDYYDPKTVGSVTSPVKVIDPVNGENNVGYLYTEAEADMICEAALDAGDAIESALSATTKGDTVRYWQKIFGSSFQA